MRPIDGIQQPDQSAAVSMGCDPALPAVWADHDRLEQVFVNLLNNAFGHNPPGTKVRVTAEPVTAGPAPDQLTPASEVMISVLDDGAGMPPELMTAAFEAARRPPPGPGASNGSSSANGGRKSAGAGFGLSIATGIVHAHGGRIELIPLPKGTCFRVHLPVEAGAPAGGTAPGGGRNGSDTDDD